MSFHSEVHLDEQTPEPRAFKPFQKRKRKRTTIWKATAGILLLLSANPSRVFTPLKAALLLPDPCRLQKASQYLAIPSERIVPGVGGQHGAEVVNPTRTWRIPLDPSCLPYFFSRSFPERSICWRRRAHDYSSHPPTPSLAFAPPPSHLSIALPSHPELSSSFLRPCLHSYYRQMMILSCHPYASRSSLSSKGPIDRHPLTPFRFRRRVD